MIAIKKSLIWRLAVGYWQLAVSCWGLAILPACSSRALHEAQEVVTQADSLWHEGQMYGRDYGDSATLAEAYHTLSLRQFFYPDDYTRCCYHYGRLLREKDNPVAAMECFINATHSRTHDYHILGRVYSNMGSICHLAGEFSFSYDMYKKSAEMFLQNGDTLSYYYGLYDMAYEKAEIGDSLGTYACLEQINDSLYTAELYPLIAFTKARLHYQLQQYDCTRCLIDHTLASNYTVPTSGYVLKAQALWHLGDIDSAVYYTRQTLNRPDISGNEEYNLLYILINYDSTLNSDEIIQMSGRRSDIETDNIKHAETKLSLAVQLLKDDLNYTPDYKRIFLICLLAALFLGALIILLFKLKQKRTLLIQEKEHVLQDFATKENEITQQRQAILEEIETRCQVLRQSENLEAQLHWKIYDEMCQVMDQQFLLFSSKLKQLAILNERDIRLCVLVLIDFSHARIAELLFVEDSSVGKLKERTAKKLHTSRKNLRNMLLKIVVGD